MSEELPHFEKRRAELEFKFPDNVSSLHLQHKLYHYTGKNPEDFLSQIRNKSLQNGQQVFFTEVPIEGKTNIIGELQEPLALYVIKNPHDMERLLKSRKMGLLNAAKEEGFDGLAMDQIVSGSLFVPEGTREIIIIGERLDALKLQKYSA